MGFGRLRRRRNGTIEVRLHPTERGVLRAVLGQLRETIVDHADDPVLGRLFPPAYEDDPEKDAGYQALARHELVDARLEALDAVDRTIDDARIDADTAEAWMKAFNALRLVLGTRLDIRDEDDREIDDDDPEAPAWHLYYFLSGIVDDLVEALS